MSLSLAVQSARSSLNAIGTQMSVTSRNVSSADDPSYSRKIASLVTEDGRVRVVISRATDTALYERMLSSTSELAGRKALLEGMKRLEETVGDTENGPSVAAQLGAFTTALDTYAARPDDGNLANAALAAAKNLVLTLNQASATVQAARVAADKEVAVSVSTINDLLGQFDKANRAVVTATASGADATDALDLRDRIVAQLSEQLGVHAVTRAGNDVALYADNGITLFDRGPRTVSFTPNLAYPSGAVGNAVTIDGVAVTGANSPMPLQAGRIVGEMALRDETAVTYEAQFDEIARSLVEAFAETDKGTPSTGPALAGLFTYPGGPSLPAGSKGLASSISVNPAADPEKGGSLWRLRDGGMNTGAGYAYNPDQAASFGDRLAELQKALDAQRSFPSSSALPATTTIQGAASASASWFEAARKAVSNQVDSESTFLSRVSTSLSNATGVNNDDETAMMLQLEKSYAASAKLITAANTMLQALLDAVR